MARQFSDNAYTTLLNAITTTPAANTSETWTVVGGASSFPASGDFDIIIDSEYMLVTARAANGGNTNFTLKRGQYGSTVATHAAGADVIHILTANAYNLPFLGTGGHGHTGVNGDGPQIGTTGIANNAITSGKLASGAAAANIGFTPGKVFNGDDYGTNGNGSTDNATAIGNALSAASSAGGGIVWLKAGTYILNSPVSIPSNVTLVGDGWGTIIKRGNSVSNDALLNLANARSKIANLAFDGNQSNNNTFAFSEIALIGDDSSMVNVRLTNFNFIGVAIGGTGCTMDSCLIVGLASSTDGSAFGVWFDSTTANGVNIVNTTIRDCRLNAIYAGGTGTRIANCYFSGNHRQTSPTGGGQIANGSSAKNMTIDGCYIAAGGGGATTGIEMSATGSTINGNIIVGQGHWGIAIQAGTNYTITGNTIKNSGSHAIFINGAITDFVIVGNRCYDDQGTKTQTWGLVLDANASDYFVVTDNNFRGNVNSDGISDSSTGTHKVMTCNQPYTAATIQENLGINGSLNVVGNITTNGYIQSTYNAGGAAPTGSGSGGFDIRWNRISGNADVTFTNLFTSFDPSIAFDFRRIGTSGDASIFSITGAGNAVFAGSIKAGGAGAAVSKFLVNTTTWDPASLISGSSETKQITVTGAALGDYVLASLDSFTNTTSWQLSARVSGTDTVQVTIRNDSGTTVNISSGTLRVLVIKAS